MSEMLSVDPWKELYAAVPGIRCKGLCHQSCGVILLQQAEYDRIEKETPIPRRAASNELACPLLVANRCSAHEARPLICRLWGVVAREGFLCPHGCEVEGAALSERAGGLLIQRANEIDPRTRCLHSDVDALVRGAR